LISTCQDAIWIAQAIWPAHDTPSANDHAAGREEAVLAARMMWAPDGIPSFAPCPSPTPSAWDGEPAAHRRGAAPQRPAGTTAQAAEARGQAIAQLDDDDDGPQTARWSGGSPGCGHGHAP
jgi:hypothetical protein